MRRLWVGIVTLCIVVVVVLSLGDLFGLNAWAWFDGLGFGTVPKGIGLIVFCALGGLAYLMEKRRDE
ncbi:hypothetical protein KO498_05440 [Lentibacter algarum]|uniref:hypothetical protein n=1 Tax=Lentibacter algarum TaxID=576131 RepID=UPI001C067C1A|nr:hypothetical protein [Lentibacter algarum]MBU2981251.1 hypothetical protein [Lentibacter algarum]